MGSYADQFRAKHPHEALPPEQMDWESGQPGLQMRSRFVTQFTPFISELGYKGGALSGEDQTPC